MFFARSFALVLAASAIALPSFAQTTGTASQATTTSTPMAASSDYSALRDNLADQSQVLNSDVMTQRAILRKNQELLKEAQRLDATNKKMLAERQRMNQQNAELERQRASLAQTQTQVQSQTQLQSQPQAPAQLSTMAKASTADVKQ